MTSERTRRTAGALLAARTEGRIITPPADEGTLTLADAYVIAEELERRRNAGGERTIGAKIGLTQRSLWRDLRIDAPIWAPVYDRTVYDVAEARTLRLDRVVSPRIEPEIVFGIEPDGATISWWAFGFEIVDCHYAGWRFTAADAVADFGLHHALIVGERRPFNATPTRGLEYVLTELQRDDETIALGSGANVMGSPLNSARWFLHSVCSTAWRGDEGPSLVTSGALGVTPPLQTSATWSLHGNVDLPELAVRIELERSSSSCHSG